MNTSILDQHLDFRNQKIEVAKNYLKKTKSFFEKFGSRELNTTSEHFNKILDALNSDAVRLVVLGEFSRGKSSLMNALLGIDLLPTALEATTAINTFIRALPAEEDAFIRVHYQDEREAKNFAWSDDMLKTWGTELDEDNAYARKTVDYIEVFMDHPLLQKGLVLVDTPGLQAVMAHHKAITEKAISQAHIALWVQNVSQLGGAATEWEFLQDTIQSNFNKFITVIGWWDLVMDPQDPQQRKKTEADRCAESMEKVRKNFRKHLADDAKAEILTNPDHLMGVSAWWAMSDDPEKRSRSGIERLSQRIADLFTSGEALEEIYSAPLKKLSAIQGELAKSIDAEITLLESDQTLEDRERTLKDLELEIRNLTQEEQRETAESLREHEYCVDKISKNIVNKISNPLIYLKNAIEDEVTETYVHLMLAKGAKQIGLPENLENELQQVNQLVADNWKQQQSEITEALAGLRKNYMDRMQQHVSKLEMDVTGIHVDLPMLDLQFDFDFSEIERHQKESTRLKRQLNEAEDARFELDEKISKTVFNEKKALFAQQAIENARRQYESLGSIPQARIYKEKKKTSDWGSGFLWLSGTYEMVDVKDDSNIIEWKSSKESLLIGLQDKEQNLQRIMDEEERISGQRMSLERAQKKHEREIAQLQKQAKEAENNATQSKERLVKEAMHKLTRNTVTQLSDMIDFLDNHIKTALHGVFMAQAKLLSDCVSEHLMEPLNAKRAQHEEVLQLMQSHKTAIENRKQVLAQAKADIADLQALTQLSLQSN